MCAYLCLTFQPSAFDQLTQSLWVITIRVCAVTVIYFNTVSLHSWLDWQWFGVLVSLAISSTATSAMAMRVYSVNEMWWWLFSATVAGLQPSDVQACMSLSLPPTLSCSAWSIYQIGRLALQAWPIHTISSGLCMCVDVNFGSPQLKIGIKTSKVSDL